MARVKSDESTLPPGEDSSQPRGGKHAEDKVLLHIWIDSGMKAILEEMATAKKTDVSKLVRAILSKAIEGTPLGEQPPLESMRGELAAIRKLLSEKEAEKAKAKRESADDVPPEIEEATKSILTALTFADAPVKTNVLAKRLSLSPQLVMEALTRLEAEEEVIEESDAWKKTQR